MDVTHNVPKGWYCKLNPHHDGPCPAWPRWWNLRWRLYMWRNH